MKLGQFTLCGATLLLLSGCSTLGNAIDAVNPFSRSAPKVKAAELAPIQPTARLVSLWQANVGSAAEYAFSPAVVGESVYAAAQDGTLARFDGGRQVWRIQVGRPLSAGVGADDKLVVVATAKGEVLAFNTADGTPVWQARVSSEVLAAPVVGGGLVVVRSGDARIFAFDATTGKRRWVYQRSTPALTLRAPVGVTLTSKALFAGFPGGKLVAIALNNGAALWEASVAQPHGTTELERIVDVASEPVFTGTMVCAVAYQGRIACFDADNGRPLWAREISSLAGLASGGRALYVTDEKGTVLAFESSGGASLWKQDKLFMRGVSRPLIVGRHVVVADSQGVIHLLSADDGAFAARQTTDGSAVLVAPQRLTANAFLVQTRNGALHAFSLQ